MNISCEFCNSENNVKKGYNSQKTKNRYYCKDCNKNFYVDIDNSEEQYNNDLIETSKVLARRNQHLMDERRRATKIWRENTRIVELIETLGTELKKSIIQYDSIPNKLCKNSDYNYNQKQPVGIIQLSDLHFGELIQIDGNEYNFIVASKRLYKLVSKSVDYFVSNNVNHVVLCMTGDLFNSNRRIEEISSQAASRANSLFIGTKLIENVILHLLKYFNVSVANISGNESRVDNDLSFLDSMISDNFDFMLFNILRYKFEKIDRVNFILGNPAELVINVNNNNILLIHGNQIGSNTTNDIQKIRGKYSVKNVNIDYILFGHLHQSYISDLFSRSSSLCGANAYSDRALNLSSRASQNIFIVYDNKEIDAIKIDLQNTDDVKEMYNINDELVTYETKSIDKLNSQNSEIVIKIVI